MYRLGHTSAPYLDVDEDANPRLALMTIDGGTDKHTPLKIAAFVYLTWH